MNNINNYLLESEVDYQRNLEGKFRYNLDPPRNKPQRGHQLAGNSSKLFPHSPSHYYLQDQILWRINLLLIAGSDPNKENMNQGFRMAPKGWQALVYIAWSIQREPLDQTDLKDGVDATQKAVENQHNKVEADRWARGPAGLTWRRLALRLGEVSSRVFWNLLGFFTVDKRD